jgi:hypothetical protein
MSETLPPGGSKQIEFPLTLSAAASPARTSVMLGSALASLANDPAYGQNTPDSLANFDHFTSSWRTSQHCLVGGLTLFSETWPRSGMMRNGIAYRLPPLVPLIDEIVSGLWQTPVADDAVNRADGKFNSRGEPKLSAQVKMWPTPTSCDYKAGMSNAPGRQQSSLPRSVGIVEGVSSGRRGGLNPTWVEWLMGFPLEWTVLKDWATPSSRKSRKSSDELS